MTSDSNSLRNSLSKTLRKRAWVPRQNSSTDGLQSFGKHADPSKGLSRSSTGLITSVSGEFKSDHRAGNGQTLSVRDPSAQTQPRTINVVLFGETGVGKSSVINLIARKEIAQVSSDVNGCTMQYKCYDISFDNLDFAIFDTIGLEEPQMGVNGYLKAIEKAYELVSKLGTAGGIHLLLFCMRGGRITATTQSNYRLFCECLCNTKVPIALVFTGLEREVEMEDWWMRNKKHIEDYGIKSDGHACITAVQDDAPGEDLKFTESQKIIRDLLKNCARRNEAFAPDSHSWFARIARGMKNFIPGKKSPKKKDVMKVLTHRCRLDAETAKKIADMMERGDTEKSDSKDPQAGNGESENEKETDLAKSSANDDITPNEHNDIAAAPGAMQHKEREVKSTSEGAPLSKPVRAATAPDVMWSRDMEPKDAAGDTPPIGPIKVTAVPDAVRKGEREIKNVTEDAPRDIPTNTKGALGVGRHRERDAKGDVPLSEPIKVKDALDVVQSKAREIKIAAEDVPPSEPTKGRAVHDVVRNREGEVKRTTRGAPPSDPVKGKPVPDVARNREREVKYATEDALLSEPIRLRVAPDVRNREKEAKNAAKGVLPSEPVQSKVGSGVRKVGSDPRRLGEKGNDGPREAEWPTSGRYSPKMPGDFTPAVTCSGS